MGGLAFLAIYYCRHSSLIRALIFSAAVMLAFNPRLLKSDIGFQLSFMAILGIIYIYPFG
jgi:predicted membrane metal-binding protein